MGFVTFIQFRSMIRRFLLNQISLSMVLWLAFLTPAFPKEAVQGEKHALVGTWKLTADWRKKDEEGKYLLIIKPDLTGTINDMTEDGTSELKEVQVNDGSLSFSFFHDGKEAFAIKFKGNVAEKKMKGNFSIFGTNAAVVGTLVTAAEADSIAAQPSIFEGYKAREFTSSAGETLPYRLFIPKDYDPKESYPIVLFYHGGGGAGNDNRAQLEGACVREWILPKLQEKHPCFIVAPQIPSKTKKSPSKEAAMKTMKIRIQVIHEILDRLEEDFSIDKNREYVTGMSFGGECTWLSLIESPNRFAAAVPICAGDKLMDLTAVERGKKFAQFPLWIVHGDADKVISVEVSRELVKALKNAGGNPNYFEYPGVGHNSWDQAYRDPQLTEWLFAQSRRSALHETPTEETLESHPSTNAEVRLASWWFTRHAEKIAEIEKANDPNADKKIELLMVGDSITNNFDKGGPGEPVWEKHFAPLNALNLGFGGDRTNHVLWRLDHLPRLKDPPKAASLMIGTNNICWGSDQPNQAAEGVQVIAKKLHAIYPEMKILVLGVFPRRANLDHPHREQIIELNSYLPDLLKDIPNVTFMDIGPKFLDEQGFLSKEMMPDTTHPSEKAHQIWAQAIVPTLKAIMSK